NGFISPINVANGGSGQTQFNNTSSILCSGTSTISAFQQIANSTAGYYLKSNGSGALPSWFALGCSVNVQTFTSSGTYTPSINMKYCIVELQAAGGGSGGCAGGTTAASCSGGGGAGAYAKSLFNNSTIGSSQTITIGAAGTAGAAGNNNAGNASSSSFGTLLVCGGGSGSTGYASSANYITAYGGLFGSVTTTGNILNVNGQYGLLGMSIYASSTNIVCMGGQGGNSMLGHGGTGSYLAAGNVSSGYGAGAGGASCTTTSQAGAVGGSGICIITEYIFN